MKIIDELRRVRSGLIRRFYAVRTRFARATTPGRDDDELLRERIRSRINELGKRYEDGNSDLIEHTYHPIPFPGFEKIKSHRTEMANRLLCIQRKLGDANGSWILDIGANVGFFAFSLAKEGYIVEAYELNSATFEIGAALSKLFASNVIYINKAIGLKAVPYLRPHYKAVLMLSVFHWIVKQEGVDGATKLLAEIARRTDQIFFETPCSDSEGMFQHEIFNSQSSVEAYLSDALPKAKISILSKDESWGERNLYSLDTSNCKGMA